jgi:spermidine dehydrogenase
MCPREASQKMTEPREYRELGMDRPITRRSFLNGVAVGLTGACLAAGRGEWARAESRPGEVPKVYYPPALTGLRGSHPGSFEVAHALRDGAYRTLPPLDDTRETYDLVVVGGGISGLAAAYFFRQALGEDRSVLILENHDDFGGHAKRNEFRSEGRLFIGYGGTMGISTPFPWSWVSKALIRELGVKVERYPEFLDGDLYSRHGLWRGMFFDRETFGADRLVAGYGKLPWEEFFSRAPLSPAARRDLIRLYTSKEDYLRGLSAEEKRNRLSQMSYQDFLLNVARVTPEAIPYFQGMVFRNAMRVDTAPALHLAQFNFGPGFSGLGLDLEPPFDEDSFQFHFPDGNATLARLLVKRLLPQALAGEQTMESIVEARLDYTRLDEQASKVRLRLGSTAVRVEHEGDPAKARSIRLAYVQDGKLYGVRAGQVILACYNSVIPYLVPELPREQKEALAYPVKVPLMYTNVLIRNWTSFRKLGVSRVSAPGMYYTSFNLDIPVSIGGYRCSERPEDPVIVHLVRYPNKPGLPRREQNRAGQHELLGTAWETIERETRRELARVLAAGGFDPAADILAITANRWPHGYAYTPDTLGDPDLPHEMRPHVIGRRPFGRIAIANSDAEAAAFTNSAIDAAHRAVQDLLRRRGMI